MGNLSPDKMPPLEIACTNPHNLKLIQRISTGVISSSSSDMTIIQSAWTFIVTILTNLIQGQVPITGGRLRIDTRM